LVIYYFTNDLSGSDTPLTRFFNLGMNLRNNDDDDGCFCSTLLKLPTSFDGETTIFSFSSDDDDDGVSGLCGGTIVLVSSVVAVVTPLLRVGGNTDGCVKGETPTT
jgi:hypothetical protein